MVFNFVVFGSLGEIDAHESVCAVGSVAGSDTHLCEFRRESFASVGDLLILSEVIEMVEHAPGISDLVDGLYHEHES